MTRVPPRILTLVVVTCVLAAVVTALSWSGPIGTRFWFWAAACLLGEVLWVRLPVGQATVSMASCFQFATLLLLPRGQAMAIAIVTGLVAESAVMRKPPLRAAFNAAQAALAVGAASSVMELLSGGRTDVAHMLYQAQILPLLAAGLVYFIINTGAVSYAVSLSEHIPLLQAWRSNFGGRDELLSNGALVSLGALIASHYATNGPTGTLLVALPLIVAYEGYRHTVKSRWERHAAREDDRKAA